MKPHLRLQDGIYLDSQFQHHRGRTLRDLIWDFVFYVCMPLLMLVSVGVLVWIVIAVGRAVRSIGGI